MWKTFRGTNITRTDKAGSWQQRRLSCFVLFVTQHRVAKIYNASPRANAHHYTKFLNLNSLAPRNITCHDWVSTNKRRGREVLEEEIPRASIREMTKEFPSSCLVTPRPLFIVRRRFSQTHTRHISPVSRSLRHQAQPNGFSTGIISVTQPTCDKLYLTWNSSSLPLDGWYDWAYACREFTKGWSFDRDRMGQTSLLVAPRVVQAQA